MPQLKSKSSTDMLSNYGSTFCYTHLSQEKFCHFKIISVITKIIV